MPRWLVQVVAASAHIGDWHYMTGSAIPVPNLGRSDFEARGSEVRGTNFAGRIESVGQGVSEFRSGDQVFGICAGAFADYATARPGKIAAKPANLTFEQAAAVPTSGFTALQALRDVAKVQDGQTVLIIGAGGAVGSFAVQIAKAFGAHVSGVCSTSKVDLVRDLGADAVIDYTRDDFTATPA